MKVMGVGEFLLHLFVLCARNERKGAKRMFGEVDGGVRKKV